MRQRGVFSLTSRFCGEGAAVEDKHESKPSTYTNVPREDEWWYRGGSTMEVAGLALAITGLAGQAITGVTALRSFFSAYKLAHVKVTSLHSELESLASTLREVQHLLRERPSSDLSVQQENQLQQQDLVSSALERRISLCATELRAWSEASVGLNIGVRTDMREFARKIKIATSRDLFNEITFRITAHRQAIGNSLSSLTLSVAQDSLSMTRGIKNQLDDIVETNNTLLESQQASLQGGYSLENMLARLSGATKSNHDDQMYVMRSIAGSMSSIASQLSGSPRLRNNSANSRHGSSQRSYPPGSPSEADFAREYFEPTMPQLAPSTASDSVEKSSSYGAIAAAPLPDTQKNSWPEYSPSWLSRSSKKPASIESWSCANVLGIEQLESTSHYCLLCEIRNDISSASSFFVDSISFGRHLVDSHYFGSCDLNRSFSSASDFENHLLNHHYNGNASWLPALSRGSSWVHDKLRIFARCHGAIEPSNRKRDRLIPVNGKSLEKEAATGTLLHARILHLLQSSEFWPANLLPESAANSKREKWDGHAEDAEISDMLTGLRSLESCVSAASAETKYRVACLMEEASISELDPRLLWQSGGFAEHAHISEFAREIFAEAPGLDKLPQPYIYSHFIVRPMADQDCVNCKLSAEMRVAFLCAQDLQLHLTRDHGLVHGPVLEEIMSTRVQAIPLELSPRCFPRILPEQLCFGRIDRWMLHCFLVSPSWRVLFRALADPAQCSVRPMEEWSVEVLHHWGRAADCLPDQQLVQPSDGAVDSHSQLSPEASAAEEIVVPRPAGDDAGREGTYTCTRRGCIGRFHDPEQLRQHQRHHQPALSPLQPPLISKKVPVVSRREHSNPGAGRLAFNDDTLSSEDEDGRLEAINGEGKATFSCPFFRRWPSRHMECMTRKLTRIQDVKQHMYRRHHEPPNLCPACFAVFESAELRDSHGRDGTCYPAAVPLRCNFLSAQAQDSLKTRINRGLSPVRQWYCIWEILFEDDEAPETPFLGSATSETLGMLRDYWRQEGQHMIPALLQPNLTQTPAKADLPGIVMDMLGKVEDHIVGKSGQVAAGDRVARPAGQLVAAPPASQSDSSSA